MSKNANGCGGWRRAGKVSDPRLNDLTLFLVTRSPNLGVFSLGGGSKKKHKKAATPPEQKEDEGRSGSKPGKQGAQNHQSHHARKEGGQDNDDDEEDAVNPDPLGRRVLRREKYCSWFKLAHVFLFLLAFVTPLVSAFVVSHRVTSCDHEVVLYAPQSN